MIFDGTGATRDADERAKARNGAASRSSLMGYGSNANPIADPVNPACPDGSIAHNSENLTPRFTQAGTSLP